MEALVIGQVGHSVLYRTIVKDIEQKKGHVINQNLQMVVYFVLENLRCNRPVIIVHNHNKTRSNAEVMILVVLFKISFKIIFCLQIGVVVILIVWYLNLKLPVQSVPITTKKRVKHFQEVVLEEIIM
jgi:hypothetical protein